jgi:hypothetical protein
MFVQVISGLIGDVSQVRVLTRRWQTELRPGARGYLGSTIGVTDDGVLVSVMRFTSREDAQVNAERVEQAAWWEALVACFLDGINVRDSDDVVVFGARDRFDHAGFVQVVEGRVHDLPAARQLQREVEPFLAAERPDLLGGVVAIHRLGTFTDVSYFVDEEAARGGEARPLSPELQRLLSHFGGVYTVEHFRDLRDPWCF